MSCFSRRSLVGRLLNSRTPTTSARKGQQNRASPGLSLLPQLGVLGEPRALENLAVFRGLEVQAFSFMASQG